MFGDDAKRLITRSLVEAPASALALVVIAGLPVLVATWALMSPAHILSTAMTWDFLFNLSGAWHLYSGQTAHIDFHEPVGQLNFILTAIGFHLLGLSPFAFLVNVAIVVSFLFAVSILASWRRLPLLPAAIFVIFVCLLALVPVNVGDKQFEYTFAMSYNRYCWSAFSILALILFVPPQRRSGDWVDMVLAALLLVAMFYLKITYFAAGLATVAFAILIQPRIRRQWLGWSCVGIFVVAIALAPFNHPYLVDILDAAKDGAVRSYLSMHLRYFAAASGEYVPYIACVVAAFVMWWTGQAPFGFPLSLAFLFGMALVLLSQNSQTAGLPSTIVIVLALYDFFRTRFASLRHGSLVVLLSTLLVFPAFSIATSVVTLGGYFAAANNPRGLYVVDRTNLRGLAVPAGERGAFAPNLIEHPRQVHVGPLRYNYSQYGYVALLLEAADLFGSNRAGEQRSPGRIALLETINPLPFMLGLPPARGANLWSEWTAPLRPPAEYLSDVDYVLIPRIPTNIDWTMALVRYYRSHLTHHFHSVATTPSWILLGRSQPGKTQPADLSLVLDSIVPLLNERASTSKSLERPS
ncbi:hypothetical protein [Reyranella sp.]|uniref:hypothetical protein n=1 Tax=Reyranella sp. TaxID=1929291 RepID=UPI0012027A9B|nr:hypothetical protein [Reyranella sp.]TAJ85426.1 MAG: hypothetical protein EPO50_16230 [Reyranella sp.]